MEGVDTDEAVGQIHGFLDDLKELFSKLKDLDDLLPYRHVERFIAASDEILEDAFKELKDNLDASDAVEKLASVGLTGKPLDFKLGIFNHANEELGAQFDSMDAVLSQAPTTDSNQKGRWRRRLLRLLRPTLKAANVILGSLAKVFPPAELIKEYKEATEAGVDLGEAIAED